MERVIIQLIMAPIGSLGFSLLFRLRSRSLFTACLGGLGCWGVYLLAAHLLGGVFLPTMLSAAFSAFYAEVNARLWKAPATVFLIPALVPLIPGSTLYYTMSGLVQQDAAMASHYGILTGQYALGIAAGSCLIWVALDIIRSFRRPPEN